MMRAAWVILGLVGVLAFAGCETARKRGESVYDSVAVPRSARSVPERGERAGTTTYFLGEGGQVVARTSAARAAMTKSWWDDAGVTGAPSVVISLSQQKASFYKGGKLVGVSAVSTGREAGTTPTGSFRITQKSRNHRSNLYGDYVDASGQVVLSNIGVRTDPRPEGTTFLGAPMPYFMRIVGGVGLHEGFLPGFPDSHGCIRMPEEMAAHFFANVSVGTPVRVVR